MLCLSGFVLHSHWVPLTIMQQSMTTFSVSFVFKGRESRSCYGINFLSQSAIDLKKSFIFWALKYNLKKETTTQILQHGISPALFEFYLFRTFLNKQGNFTFLPGRLPSLSERQCLKATSRKFPEINKNIHSW